jgi:cation diffusion facilitator family transporter
MNRLHRGLRATLTGLAVNTALAGVKLAAGVLGHSNALVADGVESIADIFSSIVVWRGLIVAAEPPDEDHPYGHGKAEPLAAAVVSAMMLAAAVWIVIEAVLGMITPHPSPQPFTLIVLAAVVVIKESLFRFAAREAASTQSTAVHTDAWHHRSDVLTSLAAAVGITVSLVGGQRFAAADDVAAIFAALVIVWNGWRLLQPAMNELMDRSPDSGVVEQIRHIAETTPGVDAVEKCYVRKMGYEFYVDMHVELDPEMTVRRSHEIAHNVKDRVRTTIPAVRDVLIHIEPSRARKPQSRPSATLAPSDGERAG